MKRLKSKKFKLPPLYFISDREDIKKIPVGVPFIYGDASEEQYIVRLLEYEILYKKAVDSGMPFNFKRILRDNGYKDLLHLAYSHPAYIDYIEDEYGPEEEALLVDREGEKIDASSSMFTEFIRDAAAVVDIQKLKDLNIFPTWLDTIEEAVKTNIHNHMVFNPHMYNKKLDGVYGSMEMRSPKRNLFVIDISGSIPKAVSSTVLVLIKNLAETFYADVLITGSKSTLYHYENLHELNISTIYEENGMGNDQTYFKNLVTGEEKDYKTAIVFGDNHTPCYDWSNTYNRDTKKISRDSGKKMCKWKIEELVSFHTDGTHNTAGYADWFTPEVTTRVANWVTYMD